MDEDHPLHVQCSKVIDEALKELGNNTLVPDGDWTFDDDTLITIIVGPEKHEFEFHKEILCARSGYFRRVLNSNNSAILIEVQTGVFHFPDDSVNVWQLIHHHFYYNSFYTFDDDDIDLFLDAYLIGDRLDMLGTVFAIMWYFSYRSPRKMLPVFILGTWKGEDIPEHTGLYKYLVDLFAWCFTFRRDLFEIEVDGTRVLDPQFVAFWALDTDFLKNIKAKLPEMESLRPKLRGQRVYGPMDAAWRRKYAEFTPF